MMNQDHYRINVATPAGPGWNGKTTYRHYFAVDTISSTKATILFNEFHQFYPDANITVTHWTVRGQGVEL